MIDALFKQFLNERLKLLDEKALNKAIGHEEYRIKKAVPIECLREAFNWGMECRNQFDIKLSGLEF